MFELKSLRFFTRLSKNHDWDDYIPIAQVHSKSKNKVVKMIMLNKNFVSDRNNIEKIKVTGKKCPKCKKEFSNKYNAQRHSDNYCVIEKAKKLKNKKCKDNNKILLNDDLYIKSQYPNPFLRDICFVAGPQGAGKSTYVKNYIDGFTDLFDIVNEKPQIEIEEEESYSEDSLIEEIFNNPTKYKDIIEELLNEDIEKDKYKKGKLQKSIYLISRISDDASFKKYINDGTMIPIDISNREIIDEPIDSKQELNNSLSIFDDYELLDKKIQKSIEITLKDVLLNGRDQSNMDKDIYCVVTGHQLSNREHTRDILNECGSITFFPSAGGIYSIEYTLKKYAGLKQKVIDRIMELPSRWITIYKRMPNYVLWEGGVMHTNAF